MAKYTRADFARLIGKKPAAVSMLVNRDKKILVHGDYIDTEVPQNKLWLEQYIVKYDLKWSTDGTRLVPAGQKEQAPQPAKAKKPAGQKTPPPAAEPTDEELAEEYAPVLENITAKELLKMQPAELLKMERAAKILKTREDTALATIKKETLEGKLIDYEVVKYLFIRNNKSQVAAFENGLNNMLNDITQRYRVNGADAARYKAMIIEIINKASEDAAAATKRELKNIIQSLSNVRGRGEKK